MAIIIDTVVRKKARWCRALTSAAKRAVERVIGAKLLRPLQRRAHRELGGARLWKLISPTGSGKSLLMQIMALARVARGGRVLITVPYRDIGLGFRDGRVVVPGWAPWVKFAALAAALSAAVSAWHPAALLLLLLLVPACRLICTRPWSAVNKCDDAADAVDDVEGFIRGGHGIMVCCHQSAARAWGRVEAGGSEAAGLTLMVDEAHRARSDEDANGIGRMVHALARREEGAGLATATFCRGDRGEIVAPEDAELFAVSRCPFDDHFRENMPSVLSVAFEYVTYGADGWDDALTEWLKAKGRRTLVYVPPPNSSAASPDGKLRDLARVVAAIERADPGADIVDLVTDCDGADNSMELRRTVERIRRGDDPDYIVALNMMKMGSDWPNLRSVADLAPSGSRPETGQKFGRLAREPSRGVEKERISFASFFPDGAFGAGDEENVRRIYSARHAALVAILLLEYEVVAPGRERGRNPATIWPPLDDFLLELASREGGAEPGMCAEVARRLMDERKVPDEIRNGLLDIVRHINRPKRAAAPRRGGPGRPAWAGLQAMELVDADFDEVRYGKIGTLMALTTGDQGGDMFDRFRASVRGLPNLTEEQVCRAIGLRMESEPGWRPSTRDDTQIPGLPPGTSCEQLHSSIRQCARGFTREEDTLRKMLLRNGVLLPEPDLSEAQVCAAIRARIGSSTAERRRRPWARRKKTESGWRPSTRDDTQIPGLPPGTSCKQLNMAINQRRCGFTREGDSLYMMLLRNGVLLPEPGDLSEAQACAAIRARMESEPDWRPSRRDDTPIPGLLGTSCKQLDSAIRQCARGFTREDDSLSRMFQRNGVLRGKLKRHTPSYMFEKWVPKAEKLAEGNCGVLQCTQWLKENGCSGLVYAMRKKPELFAHIEQEKKVGRTPKEWVPVAERLAAENGGVLQNGAWLTNNGYSGLDRAMRKSPELFAHIKQEKKGGRTPEEWVRVAEELARENGGVLRNTGWLRKNGYGGLDTVKLNRPELFAHIKKEERDFHTPEEWVQVAEGLARENGGVLQGPGWLRRNGYAALDGAMWERPGLFAHIRQKKASKGKRPEEWVSVAEALALENGGLPGFRWLRMNGHGRLNGAIRRKPELFAHIKRQSIRGSIT